MSEQQVNHVPAEKESEGFESTLSQSGFSGAGSAGAAPPPLQLTAENESAFDNGDAVQLTAEAPMQLWQDDLDAMYGATDQQLAAEQQANAPEGWNSEIGSVTTVNLDAINHQRIVDAVGTTDEGRVQNHPGDVIVIQQLLVMHGHLTNDQVSDINDLNDQGDRTIPDATVTALEAFQETLVAAGTLNSADGVVDPGGTSWNNLRADPEQAAEPTDRGDRVEFTDDSENFGIETRFADELQGLEGDERAYLLEMLSIVVGTNRDVRGAAGEDENADEVAIRANSEALDALAAHISRNTDPGGDNGDRSLVGSDRIMAFLTEIGYWTDFPRRASAAAQAEFDFWTNDAGTGQRNEGDDRELLERLRAYTYSGDASRANATQAYNDEWPWSAVFISHVHHQAGAGDTFHYDPSHSQYAAAAYQNTQMSEEERAESNEISNMFSADPATTNLGGVSEPVTVGDLIHFTRGANGLEGDEIPDALEDSTAFPSHSDMVTSLEIYAPDYNQEADNGGHHEYSAATLAAVQAGNHDYTIFALTIGGNTRDYDVADGAAGANATGTPNNANTAGLKYWPLNDDMTLQVNNAPGGVTPYGVQRLGPSIAPAPAPAPAPDGQDGGAGPDGGGN